MKILAYLFFAIVFSSLFSSYFLYKPGIINSPILEEKGEIHVGGNLGSTSGAHATYNPFDRVAVAANVSSTLFPLKERDSITFINQSEQEIHSFRYPNYQYEFALGTYWKYGEKIHHDLYLGQGFGSSAKRDVEFGFGTSDELEAFRLKYDHQFIQSSLTFKDLLTDGFHLRLNSRLNFVQFNELEYVLAPGFNSNDPNAPFEIPYEQLNSFFRYRNRTILQLGLTLAYKEGPLTFMIQGQCAESVDGLARDSRNYYSTRPVSVYVGILWRIDELFGSVWK